MLLNSFKAFKNIVSGIEKNCTHLSSISLHRNPDICGVSMRYLKKIIKKCSLSSLDVSYMQLKMTGMLYLMNSVNLSETLDVVILDNSNISEYVLGLLVLQFKNNPPSHLSLKGNNFCVNAAPIIQCLLDAEKSAPPSRVLKTLDLSNNNLNVRTVKAYACVNILTEVTFS